MIKLIAGLGNPGEKYIGTRHNIGFDVVGKLTEKLDISWSDKFNSAFGEVRYNSEKLFFLKPYTFMNLSGRAISAVANFYKIEISDIFVIHDEMNIPFNSLKIRHNGSAGGHNGLKSIINSFGSQDFPRLKMGVGRDNSKDMAKYVLNKFKPEEFEVYNDFLERAAEAILYILDNGLQKAMSIYNR